MRRLFGECYESSRTHPLMTRLLVSHGPARHHRTSPHRSYQAGERHRGKHARTRRPPMSADRERAGTCQPTARSHADQPFGTVPSAPRWTGCGARNGGAACFLAGFLQHPVVTSANVADGGQRPGTVCPFEGSPIRPADCDTCHWSAGRRPGQRSTVCWWPGALGWAWRVGRSAARSATARQ
jgi:hypothetical protein